MIVILMHDNARLIATKMENSEDWQVEVEGIENEMIARWIARLTRQILTSLYLLASLATIERGLLRD
jgi:hypothetical protein